MASKNLNNKGHLFSLMALTILFLASSINGQGLKKNCFQSQELVYLYDMKDYSGNFTNVKEYWMRLNSNCYILLDVKSKISWYSSDINVGYQMWNNKEDG